MNDILTYLIPKNDAVKAKFEKDLIGFVIERLDSKHYIFNIYKDGHSNPHNLKVCHELEEMVAMIEKEMREFFKSDIDKAIEKANEIVKGENK